MTESSTQLCECVGLGFCSRYKREVTHRDVAFCRSPCEEGEQARQILASGGELPCETPQTTLAERRAARGIDARGAEKQRGTRSVNSVNRGKPGTELKKSLAWIAKIKPATATCNCENLAAEMDKEGVKKCRERREYYVGRMLENKTAIVEAMKAEGGVNGILGAVAGVVPHMIAVAWIGHKFDAACDAAEVKAKPKARPTRPRRHNSNTDPGYRQPVLLMPFLWNPVKHLIFHIYPVKSRKDLWEWHLDWILKHKDLFNGRRIVGISIDESTVPPDEVKKYLGDGFEYRVSDNVPKSKNSCCENVTFFDSLETLSDGVCFYAHAKGVTSVKVSDDIARKWSGAMYSHLLDEYSSGMLRHNGAYGTFLTDHKNSAVLSGTFFWFRVDDAKARNWRTGTAYHSVELWPTLIFQDKLECFAKYDLRGQANIQSLQKSDTWNRLEKEWGDQVNYKNQLLAAITDAKTSEYPEGRYSGRGIIMPAGGWWRIGKPHQPYFWCAYVATSALRRKGCRLPVQWWFLPGELDEVGRDVVQKWASRVGATIHETDSSVKGGWQIKIHAILASEFEEVIHLDSDVICTIDPERLFDEPGYVHTGVHFWADNPDLVGKYEKCSYVLPAMWDRMGLPRREKIRDIEAGQMVIDKRRSWAALQVDQHFADNAEYWEGFNGGSGGIWYGDKTSHHVACLVTDTPYHREDRFHFIHNQGWYGHKASSGHIALQHCCHRKGNLVNGGVIPGLDEGQKISGFADRRKHQVDHGSHVGDYTFMHLPKTGGSSLTEALVEAGMPATRCGHLRFPELEQGLLPITILRNPVDRVLSHYNHMLTRWREEGIWKHPIRLAEFRRMSFVEFAEYSFDGLRPNLQTLMLADCFDLELALHNLEQCEYVFSTETLSEDVRVLSSRIGYELSVGRLNQRIEGKLRNTVTQAEYDHVAGLNDLDMKLWRHHCG